MPTVTFPIVSQWKVAIAMKALKILIFVAANIMDISAKFQLHPPYGFRSDFFNFCKFSLSVAMATNQIQRFGPNSYVW